MQILKPSIFLFCLFSYGLLLSQPKLVEKVVKSSPSEVVIPYQKYILPNGLTIVVHEDHSDPVVHVDVTYHVGSAREEIGKSGFAHFFEHMMFQGSDNVADEQHFKIITESGGTLNGSTNRDRTNYYETVPNNQLEKMLWLEADRMGFLLDAVTQKKFEIQRATVKNERGQNYDNRPYGLVQETLSKNLFPYGHPYSWLTIGYLTDLDRANVQDLKNFFLRWYGPNNAVLTVGGDVKTEDVLKLAEKYFGSIPAGPKVEKTILPAVKIEKDRYVSMVDNYAKIPMLNIALPTVAEYSKDEAALDCLADILGGGNSSILYQRLVKTQKALRAFAYNSSNELAGAFQFSIMPKPGTKLSEMEAEVRAALVEFEKKGVSDDDLAKFKQSIEASKIYGLESVAGKVSQLAAFETYTGNANYIKDDLKRYLAVTKEDVIRVFNQYIKGKNMVILSVLTKGNEGLLAAADNYKIDSTQYKAPDYGYASLKYNKAKDNFDRSKQPGSGLNPSIKVPAFKITNLDDMKMIFSVSDEIPTVVVSLSFKGGKMLEQNDLSKIGLTGLFTEMMGEDTKKHTSEEMTVLLEKLGSSIDVYAGLDKISVNIRSLKKNLNATLDLLEERLLMPKFTEEAFDRIKNQNIENLKNAKTRANYVASVAFEKVIYGKDNILGLPSSGTETSLKNIALADIENYYTKYVSRDGLEVVVVGNLTDAESNLILNRFKKLPTAKVTLPAIPKPAVNVGGKIIYLVDVPKAAQTEFRIGYVTGLVYDATGEYYKNGLINYPLGGAFNSRVNLNLREDKGWTYGARSSFDASDYSGEFLFSSGIKAAATDSALAEVIKEVTQYHKTGIKDEELVFLKAAIGQSNARKYETGFQKAAFIGNILDHNLPASFVGEQNKILSQLSKEEVNVLVSKWLNPEKLQIVLAGDKDKIKPGLEKLGYTIVELTPEGDRK